MTKENLVLEKVIERLEKVETKDWNRYYYWGRIQDNLITKIERGEFSIKIDLHPTYLEIGGPYYIVFRGEKVESFYNKIYPIMQAIQKAKEDRIKEEHRLDRETSLDEIEKGLGG